jgi:hypothetical protein
MGEVYTFAGGVRRAGGDLDSALLVNLLSQLFFEALDLALGLGFQAGSVG